MGQKLGNIMAQNVVSVGPQQSLQEAAQLMSQHNIGALPVVENGQVRGMITDRDITLRSTAKGTTGASKVSDCMTKDNLALANSNMDVDEAARMMSDRQIRRLPVVDNNQMVGMVALGDLTKDQSPSDASQALSSISTPSKPQ